EKEAVNAIGEGFDLGLIFLLGRGRGCSQPEPLVNSGDGDGLATQYVSSNAGDVGAERPVRGLPDHVRRVRKSISRRIVIHGEKGILDEGEKAAAIWKAFEDAIVAIRSSLRVPAAPCNVVGGVGFGEVNIPKLDLIYVKIATARPGTYDQSFADEAPAGLEAINDRDFVAGRGE